MRKRWRLLALLLIEKEDIRLLGHYEQLMLILVDDTLAEIIAGELLVRLSDVNNFDFVLLIDIDVIVRDEAGIGDDKEMVMCGDKSNDFIGLLTEDVLLLSFAQIPDIDHSILMSCHHVLLHPLIILPEMLIVRIDHEEAACCYL
jgi:hypothetical protein